MSSAKNIVVSIRGAEPSLVAAAKKLEAAVGYPLEGIELIHKDFVDNPYRVKDTTGFFREVVCGYDNPDALQKTLKPFMDRILVVTCRLEEAIQDLRKAAPYMPYTVLSSEASLLWCTEKPLMRERLRDYDPSLVPKFVKLEAYQPQNLPNDIADFTFPVIVKPAGLYGSLLVSRCDNYESLERCLERTFDVIHNVYEHGNGTGTPSVLVEEMMQGDLYSVDLYVGPTGEIDYLPPVYVVTGHAAGLPGFYSYQRILPTTLNDEQIAGAYAASKAAVRAINLRATTAHVELFLTPQGWKIIELGPRIGGHREALYREAYGIDHRYNDLAARIGMKPEIPTTVLKHALGTSIYADEEGVIQSIEGVERVEQLESTISVKVHAKAGDTALFASSGGEPIVDVILSNENPEQLKRDVAEVREQLHIKVMPKVVPLGV